MCPGLFDVRPGRCVRDYLWGQGGMCPGLFDVRTGRCVRDYL